MVGYRSNRYGGANAYPGITAGIDNLTSAIFGNAQDDASIAAAELARAKTANEQFGLTEAQNLAALRQRYGPAYAKYLAEGGTPDPGLGQIFLTDLKAGDDIAKAGQIGNINTYVAEGTPASMRQALVLAGKMPGEKFAATPEEGQLIRDDIQSAAYEQATGVANISAAARRYAADQSLVGSMYGTDVGSRDTRWKEGFTSPEEQANINYKGAQIADLEAKTGQTTALAQPKVDALIALADQRTASAEKNRRSATGGTPTKINLATQNRIDKAILGSLQRKLLDDPEAWKVVGNKTVLKPEAQAQLYDFLDSATPLVFEKMRTEGLDEQAAFEAVMTENDPTWTKGTPGEEGWFTDTPAVPGTLQSPLLSDSLTTPAPAPAPAPAEGEAAAAEPVVTDEPAEPLPPIGTVVDGHVYKGGDPFDFKNWRPVGKGR